MVANHFSSTHPRSPFSGRVFAGRIARDRRLNLDRRRLTVSRADGTVEVSEITDRQFPGVLENDFGIRLTPDELRLVPQALPAPGAAQPG